MERKRFEAWLQSVSTSFLTLTEPQKNETLDHLISLSGAVQLRHLSNNLETLLKRDFLRLLPLELTFYLLRWLDPKTLLTCCLVCKRWNKVIGACTEVWQGACKALGWQVDDSLQDAMHWKKVYMKAKLRMRQLEEREAFETSSLIGHSARVYALYYKDGLLCTGRAPLSMPKRYVFQWWCRRPCCEKAPSTNAKAVVQMFLALLAVNNCRVLF